MTYDEYNLLSDEERKSFRDKNPLVYKAMILEWVLRPLAAQATPGPWYMSHGCVVGENKSKIDGTKENKPYYERFLFNVEPQKGYTGTMADARFICAANPDRITGLLDLIKNLIDENDRLKTI